MLTKLSELAVKHDVPYLVTGGGLNGRPEGLPDVIFNIVESHMFGVVINAEGAAKPYTVHMSDETLTMDELESFLKDLKG